MENYTEIPDTQGYYLISRSGEIYSLKTNRSLKLSKGTNGYRQVVLRVAGRSETHMIHRLVAKTFIPNLQGFRVVNHLDGDKLNNGVENLEWCSYSDNSIHANRTGLTPPPPKWTGKFGAAHNRSKKVYAYRADGSLLGEFGSGNEAGRSTGIKEPAVAKALHNGSMTRGSRLLFSHTPLTDKKVLEVVARIAGGYEAAGKKRAKAVRALSATGETIGQYVGKAEAGAAFGITIHNVMDCLRFNRINRKTGLRFEYV